MTRSLIVKCDACGAEPSGSGDPILRLEGWLHAVPQNEYGAYSDNPIDLCPKCISTIRNASYQPIVGLPRVGPAPETNRCPLFNLHEAHDWSPRPGITLFCRGNVPNEPGIV